MRILVVDTPRERRWPIFRNSEGVLDLAWLPDGSGILHTARSSLPHQVWLQPYPKESR